MLVEISARSFSNITEVISPIKIPGEKYSVFFTIVPLIHLKSEQSQVEAGIFHIVPHNIALARSHVR
jgi:hypothetical protein